LNTLFSRAKSLFLVAGSDVMDTASEYRKAAMDCYGMAERSTSAEDRDRWERIGDRWIRQAIELERVTSKDTIERITQNLRLLSVR